MTQQQGDMMQRQILQLRQDVDSLKQAQTDEAQKLRQNLKRLEQEQSTLLQTGSQDRTEVSQLQQEILRLQGRLEELNYQLEQTPKTKADGKAQASTKNHEIPKDAEGHWRWAKDFYSKNEFDNAAFAFEQYTKRPKPNPKVDEAYFYVGESYYKSALKTAEQQEKKRLLRAAISAYQQILTSYPKSTFLVNALFQAANAMELLGLKKEAKPFYQEIIKNHASHKLAAEAKKHLK